MRKTAAAATVVLALAAIAAPWVIGTLTPSAIAQSSPPAGNGIPVTGGAVATSDVPVFLNAIGTVQPYNMVAIKSRVDGQLVAANFTEGQEVKAGDPLVQIDPRPYKAAFDQAVANQEKDQANLANAQRNLARDAAILKSNLAVSQQQYDNDKAAVAAGQALVDSDKAQIKAAKTNLDYTTIASPIGGRLGARLVDVGNIVHAADPNPLVTIAQIRPIFVSFTLPQSNIDEVRAGQAKAPLVVRAVSADGKQQLGEGKLTLIDNAIDQATGTIHLKASYPNQDERLWPGEFVNVRLILSTRNGVPTVPAQTVMDGPDGKFAYVIKGDNTVERRDVEVAVVQDGVAVIAKGLSPGERVVVDGQYRLTNGARVAVEASSRPSG